MADRPFDDESKLVRYRAAIDQMEANLRDGMSQTPNNMMLTMFELMQASDSNAYVEAIRRIAGDDFVACVLKVAIIAECQRRAEEKLLDV